MDEGFFQVVIYIIIGLLWLVFGGSKKKPAQKTKPTKKTSPVITDGQPSLADLLNKVQSMSDDKEEKKGPEYYSTEIYGDPNKPKNSSYNPKKKDQHLAPYKNKKKNAYVQEFLKDKTSLKKAFIMSEIFNRKF